VEGARMSETMEHYKKYLDDESYDTIHVKREHLIKCKEELDKLKGEKQDILDALNFGLDEADDPQSFLMLWREGNFEEVKECWPDFKGYLGEK
jgi:hypothetical protein